MAENTSVGNIHLTPAQRLECGELYYRSAMRYRAAAQTVAQPYLDEQNAILQMDDWLPLYDPIAQLFGQAIELYLKAHLLGKQLITGQLKDWTLGHKLDQLLQTATANGLSLDLRDEQRIIALNTYYASHRFRYPTIDPMSVAMPYDLDATCDAVRLASYPSVHARAREIGIVTPAAS